MTVLISEILEEVRTNIASFSGVSATLGLPVDSEPGLFLFAYMFTEDKTFRRNDTNNIEGTADQRYIISCLLMSSLPNDYVALDRGLRYLTETPILTSDERSIRIEISMPDIDELTQVFKSAGVSLRLAIPFILRCTGNMNITT